MRKHPRPSGKGERPRAEPRELKSLVVMMGNLLLRHEDQQNITRLDGGFVLFLRADVDKQPGQGFFSHCPTMENHEATISGEARASNAGGIVSVGSNDYCGQVGENDQRPWTSAEGHRSQVDLSGRTDHLVSTVGQCQEGPHAGFGRESCPSQGGEHAAHGVDYSCQAAAGDQPVPCHPSSLGGVYFTGSSNADRGGRSHGCGKQGVANPGQAGLHVGLDLRNSGNFCYMNSVALCLLWVCIRFPDQVMLPSMVCKLLQGASRSGQVFHVWHSFTWKAILAGWSRPLLQHDVAEFLYFICPKFPLFDSMNGHWQAREQTDSTCRITDRAIPLPLEFNSDEADRPCLVQDLIDGWHHQAQVHGLLRRPVRSCAYKFAGSHVWGTIFANLTDVLFLKPESPCLFSLDRMICNATCVDTV